LSLRLLDLVVQSTQRPLRGATVIVLNEALRNTGSSERALLPGLHEEPALIAEYFRLDQHDLAQSRRCEFHVSRPRAEPPTGSLRNRSSPARRPGAATAPRRSSRRDTRSPRDSRPSAPVAFRSLR